MIKSHDSTLKSYYPATASLPSRFCRFPPLPHFLQFYDLGDSGINSLKVRFGLACFQ